MFVFKSVLALLAAPEVDLLIDDPEHRVESLLELFFHFSFPLHIIVPVVFLFKRRLCRLRRRVRSQNTFFNVLNLVVDGLTAFRLKRYFFQDLENFLAAFDFTNV